jgi:SAM-dependent methyltransferase
MPLILDGDHALVAYDALAPHYDAFTAHHDYDAWTASLEEFARACGMSGRRLLDVACGTGKSFMPFVDRGYHVTACDVSPAMVALAASKAAGGAELLVEDMRTLPRMGQFDLVCCLDDAVNYLHSYDELVAALAGIRSNLAARGLVVFDANSLMAYRTFFATLTVLPSDDRVLVWSGQASVDFAAGDLARAEFEALTRNEDGSWERVVCVHYQRHHPRTTVEAAVNEAGLELAAVRGMRLDGSFTKEYVDEENSKAVYAARRCARDRQRR